MRIAGDLKDTRLDFTDVDCFGSSLSSGAGKAVDTLLRKIFFGESKAMRAVVTFVTDFFVPGFFKAFNLFLGVYLRPNKSINFEFSSAAVDGDPINNVAIAGQNSRS